MSLAHLESENVVGELGCFEVVEDAEYKTRWHQASLDELLMEKTVVDISQVFFLPSMLFLPIWLWGKLKNNTQNIAAPWK